MTIAATPLPRWRTTVSLRLPATVSLPRIVSLPRSPIRTTVAAIALPSPIHAVAFGSHGLIAPIPLFVEVAPRRGLTSTITRSPPPPRASGVPHEPQPPPRPPSPPLSPWSSSLPWPPVLLICRKLMDRCTTLFLKERGGMRVTGLVALAAIYIRAYLLCYRRRRSPPLEDVPRWRWELWKFLVTLRTVVSLPPNKEADSFERGMGLAFY